MFQLSLSRISVLFFASSAYALTERWRNAIVKRSAADIAKEYDYVVVGAGTAGSTVADRLSEDGSKSVLLIEYGPLALDASFMPPWNTPSPQFLYNLTSVPQIHSANRTYSVANGAVVGGGSAVNGQLFNRGSAHDFDNWAKFPGNEGWDWKGMLPYFKKSLTFNKPTKEMDDWGITYDIAGAYGGSTPIFASYPPFQYPSQKVQWEAWKQKKDVVVQKEHADGHAYGLFWIPTAMDSAMGYNRSFAAIGHWLKVPPRKNYDLLPEHRVIKVNFKKMQGLQKAVSVTILPRYGTNTTFIVKAKREVVLSAAATRTPQLLQLSGVGPKKILKAAGVETLIDLPGVGWNMQDHSFTFSLFNFTKDLYPPGLSMYNNETFRAEALAEFKRTGKGPWAAYVVASGVFLPAPVFLQNWTSSFVKEIEAQRPGDYLPLDLPKELLAGYAKQKEILLESFKSKTSAVLESLFQGSPTGVAILLKPFSRGVITLNATDPLGSPVLDYRLLSNPIDLKLHIRMVQYLREHYATSAVLAHLAPVPVIPPPGPMSDEDVEMWLMQDTNLLASNGHNVGTAAMMPRELGGVVDGKLRVYGTVGLRVVDLSIVPLIVGSHTMSAAYAVGEKAADIIKASV